MLRVSLSCALGALFLTAPPTLQAQLNQPPRPSHGFVVSGHATAGWLEGDFVPNGFFASLHPVLLFRMSDQVFAEAQLAFSLADGDTDTGLGYAAAHYLAHDYVVLSAGKFLVPFGVFSERLHPSWINRFASPPPVYAPQGGIRGLAPLLPVLADVGVMAKVAAPLGGVGRSVTLAGYLSNGPQVDGTPGPGGRPAFDFGGASGDGNDSKMVGGRAGLVLAPDFEVDVSALYARWGRGLATGRGLAFRGYNAAAQYRKRHLEVRTEWLWLRTDVERGAGSGARVATVDQVGGYGQVAYRTGAWEPVLRFGLVDQDTDAMNDRLTQYGAGLNYWLTSSSALKAAFEINRDRYDGGRDLANNRLLVTWALGF